MKPTRVYQCEDTPEGIFTAVYDAGVSGYGHDFIRIQAQTPGLFENMDLFSEYITVETEPEKAYKVMRSVQDKISLEAYQSVMRTACSVDEDKANVIYHYIVSGFALGQRVTKALQIPWVQRVFEINRKILNEVHHYIEFIRFQEVQNEPPVLLAVFEPQNHILALVTEHFADRLNPEHFIIYDGVHAEAAFHRAGGDWFIRRLDKEECKVLEALEQHNEEYADLWRVFFDSIAVRERKNTDLQRNNMPLRYRNHMTEFI